ncbi:hypothetical protein L596_014569 [Steinernema carpocapsae]|uniref:ShKT domain-containing protein n=1 Tax=Steinernema carpocapsae TaxID=34508 RepID=A0A4U5ND26_STECR|nr:hypothetical protein L596_014569 [Steinernema carpocapsae]
MTNPRGNCDDRAGEICEYMKKDCNTTGELGDAARQKCESSCGTCQCFDRSPFCSSQKDDCEKSEKVREECPYTCNYCGEQATTAGPGVTTAPGACTDVGKRCQQNKHLCNSLEFKTFMETNCRSTCGFCNVPLPPVKIKIVNGEICQDTTANCAVWARNGFCKVYPAHIIKARCPLTCNVC